MQQISQVLKLTPERTSSQFTLLLIISKCMSAVLQRAEGFWQHQQLQLLVNKCTYTIIMYLKNILKTSLHHTNYLAPLGFQSPHAPLQCPYAQLTAQGSLKKSPKCEDLTILSLCLIRNCISTSQFVLHHQKV